MFNEALTEEWLLAKRRNCISKPGKGLFLQPFGGKDLDGTLKSGLTHSPGLGLVSKLFQVFSPKRKKICPDFHLGNWGVALGGL